MQWPWHICTIWESECKLLPALVYLYWYRLDTSFILVQTCHHIYCIYYMYIYVELCWFTYILILLICVAIPSSIYLFLYQSTLLNYHHTWSFKALFAKLLAKASTACRKKGWMLPFHGSAWKSVVMLWERREKFSHKNFPSHMRLFESCEVMIQLFPLLEVNQKPSFSL